MTLGAPSTTAYPFNHNEREVGIVVFAEAYSILVVVRFENDRS
jgi:hypothetical protein